MTASASAAQENPLEALAGAVILSHGWTRRLIALTAGAVGALALSPFDFALAMIVPMSVAVWLIDGAAEAASSGATGFATLRAAFAIGWWWGFGYFLAGLWWLGAAFLVDADQFLWALPLGVVGLPLVLALFPALGFALARAIWPTGAWRPLALGVGLSASEFLRANILSGFPWNEYGMALGAHLWPAQAAAWVGLHGLTLIAVVLCATPATLRLRPILLAGLGAVLLLGFGASRLDGPAPAPVQGPKLRLIQPNVAQGADFSAANGGAILSLYLKLSDRATSPERNGIADVTHLFWPESAFPFILTRDRGAMARIVDFLRGGAVLVTGAARAEEEGGKTRYYNSMLALDRSGLATGRYDKRRLVPFGEYLPLRAVFDWLHVSQFVHVPGGFDPGVGSGTLSLRGLPDALAMVCYEAIFPNEGRARAGATAHVGYILNLTDDAWFGLTAGPHQHFAQARLRAIELGLPMLRVANTGISAIIDAQGRVIDPRPLGVEAVIDGVLPGALPPTWQARWGAASFLALTALALALCLMRRRNSVG
ncbi:MAG: apolipoprotein N-acyltransferase [Pseudomonadota bacterium]|nr:apolipoprotein N-acyltransferase [Pseudomonadota bacterium]